jgi:VanZ family protein
MAGGLIRIGGSRLYDIILIDIVGAPFFILRYDQAIHAYCYFAISVLVCFALSKYFNKPKSALLVFSVLAALGIGLLNEVIEFGMVIFADAAAAVGDYYNTALDLVFNLIGATAGSLVAGKFLDGK